MKKWVVVAVAATAGAWLGPGRATAEQELVSFADKAHLFHVTEDATCPVCGTPRMKSTQLVVILNGRYEFEDVEQLYCGICQVTTLNLEDSAKTSRFLQLLRWRVPDVRERVVHINDRLGMALKSSANMPFISNFTGLRKKDGEVYFEVD